MLSNQRNIQNLDVGHRPINRFVSGLPFPSLPSPYPSGRPLKALSAEVPTVVMKESRRMGTHLVEAKRRRACRICTICGSEMNWFERGDRSDG